MAKGVRDIRRRIKSVKATQQITRAMQMVSAVKMRRAQETALRTRAFVTRATELLGEIAHRKEHFDHPLLHKPKGKRVLLLVLTSDRGLAGGFNANVLRQVQTLMAGELAHSTVEIATSGKKGFDALTRMGLDVIADFSPMTDPAHFMDVSALTSFAMKKFLTKKYQRVVVVSTHFFSTIDQKPVVKQIMPLGEELLNFFRSIHKGARQHPEREGSSHEFLYEPSPQAILDLLLPQLVETQIFQSVLEAQASEHSARMVAMKNATDAAGDLISELTFTANQLRQSSITQEIAEITSGVNALAES